MSRVLYNILWLFCVKQPAFLHFGSSRNQYLNSPMKGINSLFGYQQNAQNFCDVCTQKFRANNHFNGMTYLSYNFKLGNFWLLGPESFKYTIYNYYLKSIHPFSNRFKNATKSNEINAGKFLLFYMCTSACVFNFLE